MRKAEFKRMRGEKENYVQERLRLKLDETIYQPRTETQRETGGYGL